MWDNIVEELARDYLVVRYDHRGHGASSVPPGDYAPDRLVQDVVELLSNTAPYLGPPEVRREPIAGALEADDMTEVAETFLRNRLPARRLIAGRRDPVTAPEHGEFLARTIPGTQLPSWTPSTWRTSRTATASSAPSPRSSPP